MRYLRTAIAAAAASTFLMGAAFAEPKTNMLHQWATGSDAQAIAKLGEMFEAKGGTWEQTSIAGHTANTLAKLRADVIAGNAPPAVQLKGPEIAEWNETGMTADLDDLAKSEGWEKVVAPELLPVMKPTGKWVAAPMNIHRINWIWASPKVMEAAGVAEIPKTWAEFNAACDKIVASRQDLHFALDRRLDRLDGLRSGRVRPGPRSLQEGFRRGRYRCHAQRGHGQGLRAVPHHDLEIHGPRHGRARLGFTMSHLVGRGRGRLPHHGRLDDRPPDRRRLQAGNGLCVRAGAYGLGQAGLHPQLGLPSCSSSRRTRTMSRARSSWRA